MSLFRRRRSTQEGASTEESVAEFESPDSAEDADGSDESLPEGDSAASDVSGASAADGSSTVTFDRSGGPFDRDEVEGEEGRLDLGALWIPLVQDIELQLQMDENTGQVTGVFIVHQDSAVQIQAFAAPRGESIWPQIRDEIAAGITERGGTADPGYGRFGRELLARVPAQQPDGKVGFQPMRFTGVDGPRWLLRAVFHGRAAIEPDSAGVLEDLVAGCVVDRGRDPMGPRELLGLRLPVEATAEAATEGAAVAGDASGAGGGGSEPDLGPQERIAENPPPQSFNDLSPFERGPEITERR